MTQELKFNIATGQEIIISITVVDNTSKPANLILHKPSLDELLLIVSNVSNISTADIVSVSKQFKYLIPRYCFCHIAHKVYGYSQSATGRLINRDHSTVINACNELDEMRKQAIPDVVNLIKNLQKHFPSIL